MTIGDEWRALCAEGPCNDPRLTPDWIVAYLTAYEPAAKVMLITVRIDGRLRGVLPLVDHGKGWGPMRFRWFRYPSNVHSTRSELIHGDGDEAIVVQAVWQFLRTWRQWDVIHFRSALLAGPLHQIREHAATAGFPTGLRGLSHDWYLAIDPAQRDVDAVISGRSRPLRKQLRRDYGRLREQGDLQLRVFDGATEPSVLQHELNAFYALEASGWKGRAGTAITCDTATRAFYDAIGRVGLQHGYILLFLLVSAGTLLSGALGIMAGEQLISLKTAYDESMAAYSPGHLVSAFMMADASKRGATELDLGGTPAGQTDYKTAWTTLQRPYATGCIHRRNLRGRAMHFVLFRMAPRLERLREQLRRIPMSARPGTN